MFLKNDLSNDYFLILSDYERKSLRTGKIERYNKINVHGMDVDIFEVLLWCEKEKIIFDIGETC